MAGNRPVGRRLCGSGGYDLNLTAPLAHSLWGGGGDRHRLGEVGVVSGLLEAGVDRADS